MAGEWIKIERSTLDKPEVMQFARLLGISKSEGLELLIRFWLWLDMNCVDGIVDGVVDADVDRLMSCDGFTGALCAVKWLRFERDPDRMVVPHFDYHLSDSAKKRCQKNRIQARWRDGVREKKASTKRSTREEIEKNKENIKRNIPDNFIASESVRAWALKTGVENLDQHVVAFVDTCKAKGYKYVDWDAALRKAVKDNWAKITPKALRVVAL